MTTNQELEEFKKKVTEVAWRINQEGNWCPEGFQEVMEELGLPSEGQAMVIDLTIPFRATLWDLPPTWTADDVVSRVTGLAEGSLIVTTDPDDDYLGGEFEVSYNGDARHLGESFKVTSVNGAPLGAETPQTPEPEVLIVVRPHRPVVTIPLNLVDFAHLSTDMVHALMKSDAYTLCGYEAPPTRRLRADEFPNDDLCGRCLRIIQYWK